MGEFMSEPGTPTVIGVIGGSGIYDIEGLENTRWEKVSSPFGEPSDALLMGELDGQKMVFLPRHGRGPRIPPAELNFRANIDALKRVGVTEIISVSACGSLKAELPPGHFVIADQFIEPPLHAINGMVHALQEIGGILQLTFQLDEALFQANDIGIATR